jgi:putative membrane protein
MMRYWGYGPSFGFFGIWDIIWFFFTVWLMVSLIRLIFGHRHHHHNLSENSEDEALKILKSRYARGEITKKEFDSMKKDIE